MAGPMPPQGAAPQGAPAPAPQQAPQGGGAQQVVAQISDGLQKLQKLMEGAGGAVTPQDKQMLGQIMSGFQALVGELAKPAGQSQAPQGPAPAAKAPMPANAAPNSKPMPPGQ